ncbi:MAG: magnesium transporter CorA family protein [Anaerolineae bacterium]|nr:magnesium transporter CorA family protein [Anaerolineae bacterium]
MIRSLVAQPDGVGKDYGVRRNLERAHLEQAIGDDCLLWLDVVDPEGDELAWLADQFQLNPAVVQDLHRDDRRPALLVYPDYLFLSLFEPHMALNRVRGREIHCLVTDRCFITVRRAEAEAVDAAYRRVAQNPLAWHAGVAYCFYLTAQHVTDAYYPLLDRISMQLNTLEEQLLNGRIDSRARQPVYGIKQQLINLRQMVAPQREVFSNVIGEQRLAETGATRDLFRHLYERLLRVYDVIDSQRDLSNNALDMMQNHEARRLMDAVNRLTIFSMIFLPLAFFTSLFELNFATTSDPFVLPISGAVLFMLVVGAMIVSSGLMFYIFRQRRWL